MRSAIRGLKNQVKGYSEAEVLVRDCTCNDEGPPDPRQLHQLANYTLQSVHTYKDVWTLLWNRTKHFQYIRHVMRGMQTIEYLLIHGNERIIQDVEDNLTTIKRLTTYKYYKDGNKEVAEDVRLQAAKLISMLQDRNGLLEKRNDAAKNKPKQGAIVGFGHDSAQVQQTQAKSADPPPPSYTQQPQAAPTETDGETKKKKKKKKKKKDKSENAEFGGDEFAAFEGLEFADMPVAPIPDDQLQTLDTPAPQGKIKTKKRQAQTANDLVIQDNSAQPAEPAGTFDMGTTGTDDWVSNITSASKQTANNNLFDDMFNAQPQSQPTNDIFSFGAPAAPATSAQKVEPQDQTNELYNGIVNTDDIFATGPKKRIPKSAAPGAKTMAQLQAESNLNNSFGAPKTQSQPATNSTNIFTAFNNPDPFASPAQSFGQTAPAQPFGGPQPGFGAVQQNPFGAMGAQANPFGASAQANPFGAQQTQANPFGGSSDPFGMPTQQQQQNPFGGFGQPQQAQPFGQTQPFGQPAFGQNAFGQPQQPFGSTQQKPAWGQTDMFSQAPTQKKQQENPFDTISWK